MLGSQFAKPYRLDPSAGADTPDDDNVETIFSYISSLVWFLMGLKGMDLDLDEVWGVILDADREASSRIRSDLLPGTRMRIQCFICPVDFEYIIAVSWLLASAAAHCALGP